MSAFSKWFERLFSINPGNLKSSLEKESEIDIFLTYQVTNKWLNESVMAYFYWLISNPLW